MLCGKHYEIEETGYITYVFFFLAMTKYLKG